MVRTATAILFFVLWSVSSHLRGQALSKEELESSVYKSLAEMQVARDRLLKDGYVCMARGLHYRPGSKKLGKDPSVVPTLLITCKRASPNFAAFIESNRAIGHYFDKEGLPVAEAVSSWKSEAVLGSKALFFSVPGEKQEFTAKQFKENGIASAQVRKHDPFDDWLIPVYIHRPTRSPNSIALFLQYELFSCQYLGSGKVEANFRKRFPSFVYQYTVIFEDKFGGMPSSVEVAALETEDAWAKNLTSYARFKWKLHDGIWLPNRMETGDTTYLSGEPRVSEMEFFLDWKLGKKVPAECFSISDGDPREAFGKLFDFDYQVVQGMTVLKRPERPWQIPEELRP